MREEIYLHRLAEGTHWNYYGIIRIFLKHSEKEVEELDEHIQRASGGDTFFLCRYTKPGYELLMAKCFYVGRFTAKGSA